jgi:hypothetical protein
MTGSDITMVSRSRSLEYAPAPDGFQIAPRNSITPPVVRYDYQNPGHGGEPIQRLSDGTPTAMYPPPFKQVPGAYSGYLVSGHRPSVNSGVVLPARQNEGDGLSVSQQLLGQTHQVTPTLSATARPIDQGPSRHQCTMCDASYARLSGVNRHYKDVHLPWISCDFCGLEFSSGRRYLLTRHLETDHPQA